MGFFPKGNVPDGDYLLGRAEIESRIAESTESETAAEAHHALASAYLGKLFSDQPEDRASELRLQVSRENRRALMSVFETMPEKLPEPANEAEDEFDSLLRKLV